MEKLVFQNTPNVEFGSNHFVNVPTILQFDDTPLIQVVKLQEAGFSTSIPIYHNDGTYLAKVIGSQIYATDAGIKAGVKLLHPDKMTVCELNGQTLFEISRTSSAALKASAELYTPEGYFVKYMDDKPGLINTSGKSLNVDGGMMMSNCSFQGCRIGVWMKSDGSVNIGCN
tara:strand:+ start:1543 stop:2055 length:513 start_codon:yes stop_codon:yes gene_type:complete